MMIDRDYLTKTLIELVSINSINPSLVADGNGEAEIGAYAAQAMQALGLEVSLDDVAPGRVNAVGVRRGADAGAPTLLLNAHMDTVGINGMERPFSPEIRQGRLYGRGSQDMKGSIAAMLSAVKALNEAHITLGGDLIIALVADEEYGSLGMEDVVRRYSIGETCLGLARELDKYLR